MGKYDNCVHKIENTYGGFRCEKFWFNFKDSSICCPKLTLEKIENLLDSIPVDARSEVLEKYCPHCGEKNGGDCCWCNFED